MSTSSTPKKVSVIGLGTMGSTLARLLLDSRYQVTVWNRTASKAKQLVRDGAILAASAADAIKASPVVVICVYDYKSTNSILNTEGITSTLAGRTLIQLTTGSPKEAQESEIWAHKYKADYLDGAIQAAPSQMGKSDTFILISGTETVFRRSESTLNVFGGGITYLGESVEAASAMDLATLSYIYGATLGFMHGAHVAETSGIPVDMYGNLVADISPTFGEFFKHEGFVIQSGNFEVSESPLNISVEATNRILQQAKEAKISTEIPELAAELFRRAEAAGYGNEEAAALIKVLRAEHS